MWQTYFWRFSTNAADASLDPTNAAIANLKLALKRTGSIGALAGKHWRAC
jgi:hypothetical protein